MHHDTLAKIVWPGIKAGGKLTDDLRAYFKEAYEEGILVRAPWWKRIFGVKEKRVKLPIDYVNLFDPPKE